MSTQPRLCSFKAVGMQTVDLPKSLCRRRFCCTAELRSPPAAPPTPQRSRTGSMIRSLAAAVELTGQVQRYETFAGRSAMVGVAVAACIELITEKGVFFAINSDTALVYGGIAAATLATAVAIALARGKTTELATNAGSRDILESVYASLTAVRRSAASVTQAQVDKAVDYLVETVLEPRLDHFSIESLLMGSDEDEDYHRPL